MSERKNLNELTAKEYQKVLDTFRVRCFHVAYMTLHDIRDYTLRLVSAIAMTSDDVLDMAEPKIREGFHKWYYEHYILGKKWGGRRGLV